MTPAALAAPDIARLVLWLGILTGAVEVALLALIKVGSLASAPVGWVNPDERLRHSYLWLSLHVAWMAPLTLTIMLAVPATVLVLSGRVERRVASFRVVFAVLAFVCCTSLLYIYPRLYDIAVVLLAAGVAVQIARLVDKRRTKFLRLVRRSVPWMAGVVLLVAVAINAGAALCERSPSGSTASLSRSAPNVLLLILDTVRAANLSLYGYSKPTTPNLERLAADAVTFDNAISTSPWTLPSHVSIFTGRLPYEFTANFLIPYGGEHTMLAEVLRRQGYATAGFTGNLVYCTHESGITRGFSHYDAHQIRASEFLKSAALGRRFDRSRWIHDLLSHYDVYGDKDAAEVTTEFLDWLDGRPQDRPFFAFFNYMDAHEPYLPPARFAAAFGTGTPRRNYLNTYFLRWAARPGREQMSAAELAAEVAAYDGTIAYVDEQVGLILDRLRDDDLMRNTVVIVVADHGEQFGEHGLHTHGNSLYLPNLHVPLVVAYGNHVPSGVRVTTPVTTRDIPATVMSLTGLSNVSPFPGGSLERFWLGAEADSGTSAEPVFSQLTDIRGAPTMKSLIAGRYHYIWGENRIEALFDIEADPGELTSLMTPDNLELVTSMRRMMVPYIRADSAVWRRLPQN